MELKKGFARIRSAISAGDLQLADQLLGEIADHGAEWHFLSVRWPIAAAGWTRPDSTIRSPVSWIRTIWNTAAPMP